jgi:hypothetical protein
MNEVSVKLVVEHPNFAAEYSVLDGLLRGFSDLGKLGLEFELYLSSVDINSKKLYSPIFAINYEDIAYVDVHEISDDITDFFFRNPQIVFKRVLR